MAEVVAAVTARLADPLVRVTNGRRNRNKADLPPRVSFLPEGGDIEESDHMGGRNPMSGPVFARQLYKLPLKVTVECWGKTEDQAEQLFRNTLAAMRHELGSGFQPTAFRLAHESPENSDDPINGALWAFDCTVDLAAFDAVVPLVHDAQISHIGLFQPPPINYGAAGVKYGDPGLKYGPSEQVC